MPGRFSLLIGLAALIAPVAHAQVEAHRDIQLTVEEGRLVTGIVNLDTPGMPVVTPGVRVFSRTLGEGAIDHFTDDPGFNAFPGTLPAATLVGFDIMDHLRVWDPVLENFDAIPSETLLLNLGGTSVNTPASDSGATFPFPGFYFASASGTGSLHQHINFFLNAPQTEGLYLLQLQLVTDGSAAPSEPVYIIFSENAEDENRIAAEAFVDDLVNGVAVCSGDCDDSGNVDFSDLVSMLFTFGTPDADGCDCDTSGTVDFADLVCALFSFGPCE